MKNDLMTEIATRDKYAIIKNFMEYLPDPDLILKQNYNKMNEMEILRKLEYDSHLIAVKQQRVLQVSSMEWSVSGIRDTSTELSASQGSEISLKDGKNEDGVADRFIQFECPAGMEAEVTEMLRRVNVDAMIEQILDALFYGYVVFEIIWDVKDGRLYPKAVVEKPQEWFVFAPDGKLKMRTLNNGVMDLPENKFLVVQHKPRYDNPYGLRLLSRCFWAVTLKKDGIVFWSYMTEKYGMPYLIGKVTRNATQEQRDSFLSGLADMRRDAVAVIEDDETIQLLGDANRSDSTSLYKDFINFQNNEISKAILTVTLTTELQGTGAYSATQTHKEILDRIALADKKMVESTINRLIEIYVSISIK